MNLNLKKIATANDLPEGWDKNAVDYFQSREFLNHTEKYNPSEQRYYVLTSDDTFMAGVVLYSLKLDLLTYIPGSLKIRMNITGIPCSVSASGFVGNVEMLPDILERLESYEKGLHLILNLDNNPGIKGVAKGRTLPSVTMENVFSSFDDYLISIKSSYRRRYSRINRNFSNIRIETGPCSDFTDEMYHQYLEVLKRSKGKLETLEPAFFKYLPSCFRLTHFYNNKDLLGWHITIQDKSKFYFFLGGIDYDLNKKYSTYFNILFDVLKQGIESGAKIIDFGQTAEIPKMRLGGKLVVKYMLAKHSNLILEKLLIAGKSMLEYTSRFPTTNVIKDVK